MVYVLDKDGKPLMPTERSMKVRHLLKERRAKVVRRTPFTIQLLYESEHYTQSVSVGIDAGSKYVGLSATTAKRELLSAQINLRNDINKRLEARRKQRRSRRYRKLRYRQARFLNRTRSGPIKSLAPSVREKCQSHVSVAIKTCQILPVKEIHIEMAPFDTQLLKAQLKGSKSISAQDYLNGDASGFDNIKAYVKWRDGFKCRVCGKMHTHLQVHHRIQRKDGGTNAPSNLLTVCEECHRLFHAGKLPEQKSKIMLPGPEIRPLNDASFMSIMRWKVWEDLKKLEKPLFMTFGYITARQRDKFGLEKDHRVDARCISANPQAEPSSEYFLCKKIRRHNRQIHKINFVKGGKRKRNQAPHEVFGFRPFDKVSYKGEEGFVFARRARGSFDIRKLDGTRISPCINYKKLIFKEHPSAFLIERRKNDELASDK